MSIARCNHLVQRSHCLFSDTRVPNLRPFLKQNRLAGNVEIHETIIRQAYLLIWLLSTYYLARGSTYLSTCFSCYPLCSKQSLFPFARTVTPAARCPHHHFGPLSPLLTFFLTFSSPCTFLYSLCATLSPYSLSLSSVYPSIVPSFAPPRIVGSFLSSFFPFLTLFFLRPYSFSCKIPTSPIH